ncbi:MAG: MoaD/ThiS family protein [Lysobacterales bacterium]
MPVRVRYFARMAEIAGCAEEIIAPVPATAAALFVHLSERHRFGFDAAALRVAINDQFVGWESVLHDGDEVALIPPVSGG